MVIQDEGERKEWAHQSGQIASMSPSGLKKYIYGGKRCAFKDERNTERVGQDRSVWGSEFQIDGAANFAARTSAVRRPNVRNSKKEFV